MRRREFIGLVAGAATAWPLAARAQQQALPVVGYLGPTSSTGGAPYAAAVRNGLTQTGYVEGQNVTIEYRWADDENDRLPALAADLVQQGVAVLVTSAIRASLAAQAATATIPVVFATANDPVQFGLVASLNRPNANVTGVMYLSSALGEKRLGLMHEMVAAATAIAILVNPENANVERNLRNVQEAARAVGLQTHVLDAASERDLGKAFARFGQSTAGALLVLNDPLFFDRRDQIVALAAQYAIPAIYYQREFAAVGGLMSYGPSVPDAYLQAGIYAGRILKGAKPAELPVLQPTKFELVINLRTAKALGLTVPPSLLARADEVIE